MKGEWGSFESNKLFSMLRLFCLWRLLQPAYNPTLTLMAKSNIPHSLLIVVVVSHNNYY